MISIKGCLANLLRKNPLKSSLSADFFLPKKLEHFYDNLTNIGA